MFGRKVDCEAAPGDRRRNQAWRRIVGHGIRDKLMQHIEQDEFRGRTATAALPLPRPVSLEQLDALEKLDEPRVVVRMQRPVARATPAANPTLGPSAAPVAAVAPSPAKSSPATPSSAPAIEPAPGQAPGLKRALDVGLTLILGTVGFPLIALIWVLIKLDSKGGGLYIQERVGHRGRPFRCWKFRTMHGDGEARLEALLASDPALRAEYEEFHKLKNDPRVTRVGFWLRKYSLDELPQLWNVLRGEMSLVGPRAYLARELPEMNGKDRVILSVKPGLTGFWQVTGRNTEGFRRRVARDVFYARRRSTAFDLSLILRTVLVVIRGNGC